jgi:8-oxo-dGTP pyrophosphatase MutT (NUDIX family)
MDQGKILVVKSAHWSLPGGKRELDEMPLDTLMRELGEELSMLKTEPCSIDLSNQAVLFDKSGNLAQLNYKTAEDILYLGTVTGNRDMIIPNSGFEIQKLAWIEIQELADYCPYWFTRLNTIYPAIRRIINA